MCNICAQDVINVPLHKLQNKGEISTMKLRKTLVGILTGIMAVSCLALPASASDSFTIRRGDAAGQCSLVRHSIKFCVKANPTSQEHGLRSKHDLGFPLNCHTPVGGDGMRAEGVNTVSAHGKNIKRENPIMQFPYQQTLLKVDWKPYPNFDSLRSNVTRCFSTPNTKFFSGCHHW